MNFSEEVEWGCFTARGDFRLTLEYKDAENLDFLMIFAKGRMPTLLTYELMIKAVGASLLFVSAGIWTLKNMRRGKERLRRLRGQIEFVTFVRERIERYLLPISQIIEECDPKTASAVVIGCEDGEYFDIEGLRAVLRTGVYYSDGGADFDRFLSSLGASYREDEIAGCDACIKELTAICERLSKDIPKEEKSRTVLSFCLAAAIVIILF